MFSTNVVCVQTQQKHASIKQGQKFDANPRINSRKDSRKIPFTRIHLNSRSKLTIKWAVSQLVLHVNKIRVSQGISQLVWIASSLCSLLLRLQWAPTVTTTVTVEAEETTSPSSMILKKKRASQLTAIPIDCYHAQCISRSNHIHRIIKFFVQWPLEVIGFQPRAKENNYTADLQAWKKFLFSVVDISWH